MAEQTVRIRTDYITLDAFLKWVGVAQTGGHAKTLIADGEVQVNGEVELRRGRKLHPGDRIRMRAGDSWLLAREGE